MVYSGGVTKRCPESDANASGAAHHERLEDVMDESHATRFGLRLTLDFEGMTWGDLRAFVRMGDISGVPDQAPVEVDTSDNYDPIGLATRVDPRSLTHGQRS